MESEHTSKNRDLDQVLAEYLRKVDAGEDVDREALLADHPDLKEDLLAYFQQEDGFHEAVDGDATVDFAQTPTRRGSRGLNIRCPHCSNGVELLADTPFEDITCASCGSTFNLAVREDQTAAASPLRNLGRFELISRLGIGGFGTVWKARDTELDRVVAIKIPRKGQLETAEIEQFYREARAAAQLRHPNIVPVHEVGREGDTIFIVCDLIRGISLADWLTGQHPGPREVSRICKTISEALHHAHEQGVIHRDMKPSNVMIDQEGELHLMDFGLAKRETNEVTMTIDGQILGTPAYMSPEQAGGQSHWTDRRTDIYSLGVMMFEMLTGEKPFRGNAQMQVHQRLVKDAPDPRTFNRHIPRDLSTICLKCLERDPNRRYSTARRVADEFERFLQGKPVLARPISRLSRIGRWCKRKPALATIAALTLVLAVAGPLVAWRIERQRSRLAELVIEKNNLIQQATVEKELTVNKLTLLGQELDKWAGRANPWQLWPPQKNEGPRLRILQRAFDKHYQAMVAKLAQEQTLSPEVLASAQLGLAMLADQTGHKKQARSHYELARDTLKKLTQDAPNQPRYMQALADCHVQLSRLYGSAQKEAAEESLVAASGLFETLAELSDDKRAVIARVDAEMRRAVFMGFEDAGPQLTKAAKLNKIIDQDWPTEPAEFYQLLSILTDREIILQADIEATEDP